MQESFFMTSLSHEYALEKYGSETEMNANHHYETFEISIQLLPLINMQYLF